MAKLSQELRRKYEENGSINICMLDERKTIFDYKILTKAIKDEYLDLLKFAFSDAADKTNWSQPYYSSNHHFAFFQDEIVVFSQFSGHRLQFNKTSTEHILRISPSSLTVMRVIYRAESDMKLWNKLRLITNSFIESNLGFPEITSSGMRYNKHYNKDVVINDDLRKVLDKCINIGIKRFTFPGNPNHLRLDEESGYINYKLRGRQIKMKAGKGLKKFFKLHGQKLTDEEVKNASNRLNADVSDFKLKVVTGKDIDKYYYYKYYDDTFDTNSLSSSCMRGDDAQDGDFFAVYKEHASMLILHNEDTDLIIGRAILWNGADYIGRGDEDESLEKGDTVDIMDRIYAAESVYSIFKDWALENNYYRKRYQSYNNETLWRSPRTGDEVELEFSLDINLNEYENVPYMDTFAWGDSDVVINEDGYGWYAARSTEGILEGGDNEYRDEYDEDEDCDEDYY